jgi:hypothetical protein
MASIIKADNIQKVSDGTNIIKKCGSTITLGSCGATIALACGATQTGFGRTGTVDWCTTAKTAPFTGVSGKGYFVNTTCGAVTVTLPATPTAGDIISIADYASTWQTNTVTLCRNSSKINGSCTNSSLSTQGQSITLVYVDGTRGWKNTMDSTSNITGQPNYIIATGGTEITCGDFKTHIFTADGCFAVTNAGSPTGSTTLDYLVVAGGGGGGYGDAGGGGAGGFRLSNSYSIPAPTISPLANPTGLTASLQTYSITVGAGGSGGTNPNGLASAGGVSTFGPITSTGGGRGSGYSPNSPVSLIGGPGGSGSGSSGTSPVGLGNTPPVSPPQGNNGGAGAPGAAGGGGGAGGVGGASPGTQVGGAGGIGSYISDTFFGPTAPSYGTAGPVGSTRYFAGGAGGYGDVTIGPAPSAGGGGQGSKGASPATSGTAGTTNTGGGGGSGIPSGPFASGHTGGSGIVMIRYKYQN